MKIAKLKMTIFFALLLLFTIPAAAQTDNVTLLTGTIYNSASKEPVQTTIFFIDNDGKEIQAKSEMNGQYQIVLTSGKTYTITAKNYLVLSGESSLDLPTGKEYKEVRRNIELQKIVPGLELFSVNAFGSGKEVLNDDGLAQILKLKTFLNENLNVKVKILFSCEDTYFKTKTVRTKVKKKIVTTSVTADDQMKDLLEKRKSNISDILTSLKIRESRYTLEALEVAATKPVAAAKNSKKTKKSATTFSSPASNIITMKIEIEALMNM